MRKLYERTSVLALAALLAVSASGYSSGTGGQTMVTPDITTQTETSNEESRIEESKDAGEPIMVRLIYYMRKRAKRGTLNAMLAAFSETHSETKVGMEVVVSSSYIATYKNYIAAGEAPGIMLGKPQTMQKSVDGGYFMDLKDETYTANVLPVLVDGCTASGGVYGLPTDAQVKATSYSKKVFQETGVEVPATKGKLFKVCDTFTDQGIYPFVHPYSFIHGVFHELDSFFTSMTAATDNENAWMDSQSSVKDLSGNPAVVEATEMFSKFASYKDAGGTAVDQAQGIRDFATGQRPMYMNGEWLMGDVIAVNPGGEFGMFPTPWSGNPEKNKLWIGTDDVLVASQQTEHRDEVMTLLNFFANEESSKTRVNITRLMTSNITVPTDDVDVFIREIKSYIDNGMAVPKGLAPDYTSEYSTAFHTKLQELVALDDSQRDVTKLLEGTDDEIASIRQQFLKYI